MSKARWVLDKIGDIIVDVIAGFVLYLILGGYISQPLLATSPYLPTLLIVSLALAIVIGFIQRVFKSVKFHVFVERSGRDLMEFLHNWDELINDFTHAENARYSDSTGEAIKKFEDTRAMLQYNYPKIALAVKISSRYSYVDRIQGISVQDFDVIGNLLLKSPFIGEWSSSSYADREFRKRWDTGRHILVTTIGSLDVFRQSKIHQFYWIVHFVPILEPQIKTSS